MEVTWVTMFHYPTHSLDVSCSVLVSSPNLEILGPEFTFLCSNHLDLRSFHHEIFKVINPAIPMLSGCQYFHRCY